MKEIEIKKQQDYEISKLQDMLPELKLKPNDKEAKPLMNFVKEGVYITTLKTAFDFDKLTQLKVFEQQGGMLCGFHCYWNT